MNGFCYKPLTINHKLILVGTNYKYSPIELRERLSFSKNKLKDALNFLRERDIFSGAIILSTCNRVEVYASVEDTKIGIRQIEDFISIYHEIDKRKFLPYLYVYEQKQAMKHLFSVACGLDSLIVGETQILGQVKFCFLEAESIGFADGFLKEIFYSAISFAKRIHAETKISEGKVSVGSVAVDFIKERIKTLSDKNILIIGTGKVTELVLRYLSKENPKVVFVSNRTYQRARQLASQIGARAIRFDDLKQFLKDVDIILTATASPHCVIKRETLQEAISVRRSLGVDGSRKLLIIDLAIPRDVEPEVGEIENVDLFGLEDLDTVIKKNMERKFQEAEKAREIVDIEVERLWNRLIESEPEPVLLP
jgi:glutamyl-tRNA reductase